MRTRRPWLRLFAVAAVTALAVTASPLPGASAAPTAAGSRTGDAASTSALPRGWTAQVDAERRVVLTWTSPAAVPVGGARLEVRAGERSLGIGRLSRDRRQVSLTLTGPLAADRSIDWSSLQVVAAGRRLDVPLATGTPRRALPPGATQLPSPDPLLAVDPGRPGPYATRSGEYLRPALRVAGLPEPVEVRAVVVSPVGAPGRRPLVLLLHGRHTTCFTTGGESSGDWPCPAGWRPVPSHRGYLQTQQLLASQGYVTASVSANGINGQDYLLDDGGAEARSVLVRHHLALWQRWSASAAAHATAPDVVRRGPRADLVRVLLVGHSRGGEGANRAALDSTTGAVAPWTIRGVVHIGPTAFGQNPAPGVPVVVLLPACDGDVFDLQGQAYVDAARDAGPDPVLRSSVMVLGANHNYFNREWTPGATAPAWDDWGAPEDPLCGTGPGTTRLSPAEQRAVGATYAAAAAAVLVAGDARVLPLLDGSRARAASAGPARVIAHALGARRAAALVPTDAVGVSSSGGVSARLCRAAEAWRPAPRCAPEADWGTTPHFLPLYGLPGEPSRRVVEVAWTDASGSATLTLPRPATLVGGRALAARVVVPPGTRGTTFGVRLVDSAGGRLLLPDVRLDGLPGAPPGSGAYQGKYWAREVRLPLDPAGVRASGIDLSRVVSFTLLPRSASGRVWVLDAWRWQPGTSEAEPLRLPRLDVGRIVVDEGDTPYTVRVPITVTGPARSAGRVWIAVLDPTRFEGLRGYYADVPAGARRVDVRIRVPGDTRDDFDVLLYAVVVKAVRGVGVGDYVGGLTILDDDPAPVLTVTPVADSVVEGEELVWRLSLSAASDAAVVLPLEVVPPDATLPREVDTADLPGDWLRDHGVDPLPDPPVPLSEARPYLPTYLDAGVVSLDLRIATRVDSRREGRESVSLRVMEDIPNPGVPLGTTFVGIVRDG